MFACCGTNHLRDGKKGEVKPQSTMDMDVDLDEFEDAGAPATEEDMNLFRGWSRIASKRFASFRRSSMKSMAVVTRKASVMFGIAEEDEEEMDDSEIPEDFLDLFDGDVKKATKKYKAMLEWRKRLDIDNITERPFPDFDLIKNNVRHYLYGFGKDGFGFSYELMGAVEPSKFKATREDVEKHLAFMQEFNDRVLKTDRRYTVVMDMKGMGISKASNPQILNLTRWYAETLEYYYPGRVQRVLIVNAPFGAGAIVKILTAVLPTSFSRKIKILGKHQELHEFIDPSEIPREYGGNNTVPLDKFNTEVQLLEYVDKINTKPAQ